MSTPYRDRISEKRIITLHPVIRYQVLDLFNKANNEVLKGEAKARVTCGLRSFEEQDKLYAQGRTAPGKIVTKVKGGYSYHNYGLAFDFCLLIKDGKEAVWSHTKDFDKDSIPDWMEFVNLFKSAGYEWGGDWKSFKDRPHLQKTFGFKVEELLSLPRGGGDYVML